MEQIKIKFEMVKSEKNLSLDEIFKTYDRNDSNRMEIAEFNEMIKNFDEQKGKFEIDCLFKHCDQRGAGYITKEDLK